MKGMRKIYITAYIRYDDKKTRIILPANDNLLHNLLNESGMPTDTTLPFTVREIEYPNELSILEGRDVNLDELNYLSKQLDVFTEDELMQFYVALDHQKPECLKDMINLAFNLDKFTLIRDVGDMIKVGRRYTMNTEGSIPADSSEDEKFAQIGKELLSTRQSIITDKGLLFVEDKPIETIYDGKVFPPFAYYNCIACVILEHEGKKECLFLPDSKYAIEKAVTRIGASSLEDCSCEISSLDARYEKLESYFDAVLGKEGINNLNSLLRIIYDNDIEPKKLRAAIDYAEVSSSKNIGIIAENLDDFDLIEDVCYGDYDFVGRYFVDSDCYDEYDVSDELRDFVDFAEFGEHIIDEKCGEFVSEGLLFYDRNHDVSEILDQLEDEDNSMTMGGL